MTRAFYTWQSFDDDIGLLGRVAPLCLDFEIPRGFAPLPAVSFFGSLPLRGPELLVLPEFERRRKEAS